MEKQERKQRKILTDNRMATVNKRETSFEGLVSQFENGEDGIYNLITNNKNIIFQPKVTITKKDIEEIPQLRQLREAISYWEQRTGREAQEALKEAKKNLQELDEEWQEQLEDWSIDDQIKAIEAERDAQIKATEAAQEAEIKGIEKVYDEKVKKFAETGEIIYEGSTIQSKKLYNQYKTNFIDPITKDLKNLKKCC